MQLRTPRNSRATPAMIVVTSTVALSRGGSKRANNVEHTSQYYYVLHMSTNVREAEEEARKRAGQRGQSAKAPGQGEWGVRRYCTHKRFERRP